MLGTGALQTYTLMRSVSLILFQTLSTSLSRVVSALLRRYFGSGFKERLSETGELADRREVHPQAVPSRLSSRTNTLPSDLVCR